VEPLGRGLRIDLLTDRCLAPAEAACLAGLAAADRPAAFLRLWTRKEAVAKCDGVGLRRPLRDLDVSEPRRMPGFHLVDLDPASGHLGALAVRTPAGVSVTTHDAGRLLAP
jgi:4'-phosphopantetheinyl transferase